VPRALLVALSLAVLLARDGDAQSPPPCPELPFNLLVAFNYLDQVTPLRAYRPSFRQAQAGGRPGHGMERIDHHLARHQLWLLSRDRGRTGQHQGRDPLALDGLEW
jgi:hypothetical protein